MPKGVKTPSGLKSWSAALSPVRLWPPREKGPMLTAALASKDRRRLSGACADSRWTRSSCAKMASVSFSLFGAALGHLAQAEAQGVQLHADGLGAGQLLGGVALALDQLLMDVGGGQAAILARGLEGGIGLGVVGDDVLDVVEQPGQPDLGGLAAARGGVGADDAGVPLVQGLADGIAAPAEELLGAALAEAQASDGVGDKAAALGAVEGVGGVLEEIAELGHPLHKSASWLGEADSVQSSQDQAITRIRLTSGPTSAAAWSRTPRTANGWRSRSPPRARRCRERP